MIQGTMRKTISMKYEGLIFDFNGVLWWDTHLQEVAWEQFSSEIRGAPFSHEEMTVHVHGRNNQHKLENLTGKPVMDDELERLTHQKGVICRQLCLEQGVDFRLSAGAVEPLNFLVSQDIPHTIATATRKTNLDSFVKHLSLLEWFDLATIVFDDGRRPGKPAPDIFLEVANRLELEPGQCAVVEESHSGIEAADAAGMGQLMIQGRQIVIIS
jgi:beta-phosphoglucomutase-like phosphatase (HAD superfamily)